MKKLDLMLRGRTCQRSNQLRTPLTLPAPVPAGLASILILDHRIMIYGSWVLIIYVIHAETQDFGIPDLDSLWEQMSRVGPCPKNQTLNFRSFWYARVSQEALDLDGFRQ